MYLKNLIDNSEEFEKPPVPEPVAAVEHWKPQTAAPIDWSRDTDVLAIKA